MGLDATVTDSQINQSKRPSVADNTTLLFCTAYDTYCKFTILEHSTAP